MYKAIIFDLGNVIVNLSFDNAIKIWSRCGNADPLQLKRKFRIDRSFIEFETGLISPEAYRAHVSSMLDIRFEDGSFEEGWNSILEDIMPGIPELLPALAAKYRLVVLSNTNAIHYEYCHVRYGKIMGLFEKVFASNIMQVRKPDPAAYAAVIGFLGVSPRKAVFFDDTEENVRAAEDYGIKSFIVSSTESIKADLLKLGLL